MTDYTELKRLAESADLVGGYISAPDFEEIGLNADDAAFAAAANPAAVLALIAENVQLKALIADPEFPPKHARRLIAQLRQELSDLWPMHNSLKADNEALRQDAERYRWLRDSSESIHQFYLSTPIWFTGVKFSKENVDSTIDSAMGKDLTP